MKTLAFAMAALSLAACTKTNPTESQANTSIKPAQYICSNVSGVEEWTIYIDFNKKLAGFFDNDNTAVVPLKDMKLLESVPPQRLYIFEGKDSGGGSDEVLRISFNETKMTGSVTTDAGGRKPNRMEAEGGCKPARNIDIDL